MTQSEIGARSQFGDIICSDCKAPASKHGLHDEIHVRGKCPWTWVGVIRREYARAVAERCTNPLRSEITCDMLVRDNDALRAKLSAVAALPDKIRKLKEAKDLKHYAALLIEETIDADVQGGFTRDVFEAVRG